MANIPHRLMYEFINANKYILRFKELIVWLWFVSFFIWHRYQWSDRAHQCKAGEDRVFFSTISILLTNRLYCHWNGHSQSVCMEISQIQIITMAKKIILSNHSRLFRACISWWNHRDHDANRVRRMQRNGKRLCWTLPIRSQRRS